MAAVRFLRKFYAVGYPARRFVTLPVQWRPHTYNVNARMAQLHNGICHPGRDLAVRAYLGTK